MNGQPLDTEKGKDVLKEKYKKTNVKRAKKIVHKKSKDEDPNALGTDEPAWIQGLW